MNGVMASASVPDAARTALGPRPWRALLRRARRALIAAANDRGPRADLLAQARADLAELRGHLEQLEELAWTLEGGGARVAS